MVKHFLVVAMSILVWPSCAGSDLSQGVGGSGLPECLSSNECPAGFTCTEFGTCVAPPAGQDAGTKAEVEIEFSISIHSDRYVYVAMSEFDAIAKIDAI